MALFGFGKKDDVVVKYGADSSKFQKVTAGVKRQVQDLGGFFGDIGKSIGGFFTRTLPGAVAGLGAAFGLAAKSALEFGDNIAKTSDRVGFNIENLQELRYAASASGIEQEKLDTSLQRFSRRLGQAAQGTGELRKDLDAWGISLRDKDGKLRDSMSVLRDYSDAIQRADGTQEKLRLAFNAFGKEGAGLVVMLKDGARGLDVLRDRARELGLVIDSNTVRSAEALNQQWDDFTDKWSMRWKAAVLDFVDTLNTLAENFQSVGQVQKALDEQQENLTRAQEDYNNSVALLKPLMQWRIDKIKEEIDFLKKKKDELQGNSEAQKELNAAAEDYEPPNYSGGKATGGKGSKGSKSSASPEDWREKTPEEIQAALNDFRSGKISDVELGERSGLAPPGSAASTRRGAYGTLSNTGAGPKRPLDVVVDAKGLMEMSQQIVDFLAKQSAAGKFNITIKPSLDMQLGDAASIENSATEEGYRQ